MNLADTIVALATPGGCSARAMIRISGPQVSTIFQHQLRTAPTARGCAPARLVLEDKLELPVLVARFLAPASYTGEDACEIQFPGNPHLAERILASILRCPGTRLSAPGEFSARAFLRGKLTLNEAEGVAATIAARSSEQLEAARSLLSGTTGTTYRRFADECAALLALVEAGIDFTDQEDVVPISPIALGERLDNLSKEILAFLGAQRSNEHPDGLPRIAIVGKPNAGKSTLFNALLGRTRAVADPSVGTTRDVLSEPLDLSSVAPGIGQVMLQDLPGLDDRGLSTMDRLAQAAAQLAFTQADVLLWCDPLGVFDEQDLPLASEKPTARVRTFGDRPNHTDREDLSVCALDGWNLGTLRRTLADLACDSASNTLATLLPRHRRALALAREALHAADTSFDRRAHSLAQTEVVASHLRTALNSLGELVGHISPDDVIGRVFATFCVGK